MYYINCQTQKLLLFCDVDAQQEGDHSIHLVMQMIALLFFEQLRSLSEEQMKQIGHHVGL